MGFICALILYISLRLENRRRDRLYGHVVTTHSKADVTAITKSGAVVDVFGLGEVKKKNEDGVMNICQKKIFVILVINMQLGVILSKCVFIH